MVKTRDYCCCAIPLVNAGIYAAIAEQFVLSVVAGALAFATPKIVGASTPSFAAAVFAVVCFAGACVQVLGIIGVSREQPTLYRRYVQLNLVVTLAVFAIAAAWTIISATGHSKAQNACLTKFFPGTTTSTEGTVMCNVFAWVDVGIMGGLLALFAIVQLYMNVVVSSYSAAQRKDHKQYEDEYNATNPLTNTNSIPMMDRSDPWDSRASVDTLDGRAMVQDAGYGPVRKQSVGMMPAIGEKPERRPSGGDEYLPNPHDEYQYPAQPSNAYTNDPEPTPQFGGQYYASAGDGGLAQPGRTLPHPAEGSFGRKTPRQRSVDQQEDPYYGRR